MIIRYLKSNRGVRFYSVLEHGEDVFMGTLGECKRFVLIHNEKVMRHQEMELASRQHARAS
jgi:hypothetical protein